MTVDDNSVFEAGSDERRMHVRAYNYWVSLLNGRDYPAIEDLDPENIADFGPNSVLLDFTGGIDDPAIQYLGRELRDECQLDPSIRKITQVPSRSLLSRLTDHYLQIIANRAPIGFEAEFVSTRGLNTMYRGILMPFSSDDDTIDFIYGVINWKELADAETQAALNAEIEAAVAAARRTVPTAPIWADGPGSSIDVPVDPAFDDELPSDEPVEERAEALPHAFSAALVSSLGEQLMFAQQTAAAMRAADTRSRAALYRALGRAYDFAQAAASDANAYAALLADAGITVQARAPMTPIVKLVFGVDYDKTRITEFATVLDHAQRLQIPAGELPDYLDTIDGGVKGVVKAERAERNVPKPAPRASRAANALRKRPALASVAIDTGAGAGEFVLLVARSSGDGLLDIVASVREDALTQRVIRAAR